MRDQWRDRFDATIEFISNRNLKRESYGSAVNWVHIASQKFTSEIIIKSFSVCSLCLLREIILLNDRLSEVLGNEAKKTKTKFDAKYFNIFALKYRHYVYNFEAYNKKYGKKVSFIFLWAIK